MFDLWMGEIELTAFTLLFSLVVLLPMQLFLCFRIKSKIIRLLPVILLSIPVICLTVMAIPLTGWDDLGYLLLAILAGFALLVCGIGWGIWGITKWLKRKKQKDVL